MPTSSPTEAVSQTVSFAPTNFTSAIWSTASGAFPTIPCEFSLDRCGERATLNTETGATNCFDGAGKALVIPFRVSSQGSATSNDKIAVFNCASLLVEQGVQFRVSGKNPVMFAVRGTATIAGQILANATGSLPGPGGFGPPSGKHQSGLGLGAGHGPSVPLQLNSCGGISGAGGASYCGRGAPGGQVVDGGIPGAAGNLYGSQHFAPLLGGSSGGNGGVLTGAGAGGGAVHIAATTSIEIPSTGLIHAGGGGGYGGCYDGPSGAGSGGAILLEAQTITVSGTLAANGGAGGGACDGDHGRDGTPNADRALSNDTNYNQHLGRGGWGSGGGILDGTMGLPPTDSYYLKCSYGAAGGGSGRIRLSGAVQIGSAAVISPHPSTSCATIGALY